LRQYFLPVGVITTSATPSICFRISKFVECAAMIFVKQPDRRYVLGLGVDEDRGIYEFNVHDRAAWLNRVVAAQLRPDDETRPLEP
jgi:hypothetical protein